MNRQKATPNQRQLLMKAAGQGLRPNDKTLTHQDFAVIQHLESVGLLINTRNRRGRSIWRPTQDGRHLISQEIDTKFDRPQRIRSAPATSRSPHAAEILKYWRTVGIGEWFVYFIQQGDHGPIKIGRASDPPSRVSELQCGNPAELHLREVVLADTTTETTLHGHWRTAHIRGEWFGRGYEHAILSSARQISDAQREARRTDRLDYADITGGVLIRALFAQEPTQEVVAA